MGTKHSSKVKKIQTV